jgi:hypothetical protein
VIGVSYVLLRQPLLVQVPAQSRLAELEDHWLRLCRLVAQQPRRSPHAQSPLVVASQGD